MMRVNKTRGSWKIFFLSFEMFEQLKYLLVYKLQLGYISQICVASFWIFSLDPISMVSSEPSAAACLSQHYMRWSLGLEELG